jgi:hypothetical protein
MVFKVARAIAASMLALGAAMAHADATNDTIDKYVTFSAFGTLGVVHSDYSKGDFVGNVIQPGGAAQLRTAIWAAKPISR